MNKYLREGELKEIMVTFLGVRRPAGAWRTTPEGSRPGRGGLARRSPPPAATRLGPRRKPRSRLGVIRPHTRGSRGGPEAGPGEPREEAPALALGGGAQAHPAAAAPPLPGPRRARRARPAPSRRGPGSAEPRCPGRCSLGGRRGAGCARGRVANGGGARPERAGRGRRVRGEHVPEHSRR